MIELPECLKKDGLCKCEIHKFNFQDDCESCKEIKTFNNGIEIAFQILQENGWKNPEENKEFMRGWNDRLKQCLKDGWINPSKIKKEGWHDRDACVLGKEVLEEENKALREDVVKLWEELTKLDNDYRTKIELLKKLINDLPNRDETLYKQFGDRKISLLTPDGGGIGRFETLKLIDKVLLKDYLNNLKLKTTNKDLSPQLKNKLQNLTKKDKVIIKKIIKKLEWYKK